MGDNKKLLPCPFCGGEARFRTLGGVNYLRLRDSVRILRCANP